MNWTDYQAACERTVPADMAPTTRLANFALGLCGEAGEAGEVVKKHLFHGHALDPEKLRKELGDVLWYVATLATTAGLSLEDVAGANIAKLRARYPEGFSTEASVARVDAQAPRGCANEVADGAGQGSAEIVQQNGAGLVEFDSRCPSEWRKGNHEWYGAPRSGFACRACGARSTAPGWDANGSEVG